jgi:hypothetical protein
MNRMRAVVVLTGLAVLALAATQVGDTAAQSAAAQPKIGSTLIGKLEGPEIILDAKAIRRRSRKRRSSPSK